ncbi:MAG TPA: SDR family NAD(P)-dependent oxidoreductase [Dermatophilaceae bacterium]|jgi:2-dehydro-3-deoxy-L-rhamnonate dehydrogenase (NAD+)|nr:SDR family NAD(P)-dependent oxidoreductase [Dermatophilaceae bacterium]
MINYDLGGKVAVITGGASGIGLACAHTMARSGADVSVWDLDKDAVDETAESLAQYGHRAHGAIVDVSDSARVDEAMNDVVASLGRVDIAVCNAGIGGESSTSADYSDKGWQQVIGVNLNGVFFTQRAAIRAMKATGGGSIINMASILGQVGFATASAYAAAKHGVVGLTQTAAWEHAADGVRVNAVGPGFIETPMLTKSLDQLTLDFLATQHALGRIGKPEEVAELVAWLASDASSFATGTYYPIDGGYLAR